MILSESMNKYITQDPDILSGKPIITGTRMSVSSIMELLASGMDLKEILDEYPFLTREQVQAAIEYAAKIVQKEKTYIFRKKSDESA